MYKVGDIVKVSEFTDEMCKKYDPYLFGFASMNEIRDKSDAMRDFDFKDSFEILMINDDDDCCTIDLKMKNGTDWWVKITAIYKEEEEMLKEKDGLTIWERGECKYDVFDDLKVVDGWYIKKSTKLNIYRTISQKHRSVWERLMSESWFTSTYKELIEEVKATDEFIGYEDLPIIEVEEDKEVVKGEDMSELLNAVQGLTKVVEQTQKQSGLESAMIEAIISKGKDLATEELELELKERLNNFIEETYGALPTKIQLQRGDEELGEIQGVLHEKFNVMLKLIDAKIPTMVVGPAGTGKNHTLEQVADALGLSFYYTGAVSQEYKITGFIDAGGEYHATEFFKAFTEGGVFMLDEIDASSPEVLVLLNGAIANRYFDFPTGRELAHEDFRVVCAGNTFGTGADAVYVGRNVLDGATLDRFVVVEMDYSKEVETQLCPDEDLYNFIIDVRQSVNKSRLQHIVSMRTSINSYKARHIGLEDSFITESIIFKGLGVDDLNVIFRGLNDDTCKLAKELRTMIGRM